MTQYAQFQSHNNVGNAKISVANLMLEEISFSLAPVWAVAVVSGVSGLGSGVQWSQSPSRARGSLNKREVTFVTLILKSREPLCNLSYTLLFIWSTSSFIFHTSWQKLTNAHVQMQMLKKGSYLPLPSYLEINSSYIQPKSYPFQQEEIFSGQI